MSYPLHVTNSKEYIESLIAIQEMEIKALEDKILLHNVNTIFSFEEAKEFARKGVKMTHKYFTDNEYITMKGNCVIFEDGVRIFVGEWSKGKDYLLTGWSIYKA